jgi:SAM-dependent methyltransferase
MKKLTSKAYWDDGYASKVRRQEASAGHPPFRERLKERIRRNTLLRRLQSLQGNYDHYLLWKVLYPRHLPSSPGFTAIEIGSAPGHHLLALHRQFGANPFGVEYAEHGAALNRNLFTANGIPPDHVFHTDFFADSFLDEHEGRFDVVLSRGFIEHFDDPASVVGRHIRLLRPGGTLIISIPRYRGVYWPWSFVFDRQALAAHNLKIMTLAPFRRLFERPELRIEQCGYFGTLSLYRFRTKIPVLRQIMLAVVQIQRLLNVIFRLVLGKRGAETRLFSPYLVCVATRIR